MKYVAKYLSILTIMIVVSACGTTSHLESLSTGDVDLSRYKVVSVQNLENNTPPYLNKGASRRVDKAGWDLANKIAVKLRGKGVFEEVTRLDVEGPALVIKGEVNKYYQGNPEPQLNLFGRMLIGVSNPFLRLFSWHLTGHPRLHANIYLVDNETGYKIGVVRVRKHNWGVGGFIARQESLETIYDHTIRRVVSEVAKAKKAS